MSHLERHLNRLAVEIGPRPAGSLGHRAAERYIRGVFEACGLAAVRQAFPVPTWQAETAGLWALGREIEIAANPYSPGCAVEAPLVWLWTLEMAEAADLRDRIAVLTGELSQSPLPAKAWPFKDERAARLVEVLEAKRPAALLLVQHRPGRLERLAEDWAFPAPSATLPAEAALQLWGAPKARLVLETTRGEGEAANVIARRPGAQPERVVVCAHYDTKFDTPGASDNAGGVAVLLALAEALRAAPLERSVEFVAFTNEEYLPLGDDAYVCAAGEALPGVTAAVNLDGVGPRLGANTLTAMGGPPAFEARCRAAAADFPGVLWVPPWPESNHSTFAMRGVPAAALSNTATRQLCHLRTDTAAWMGAASLAEAHALALRLITDLTRADAG